jgi:hypothetical protein
MALLVLSPVWGADGTQIFPDLKAPQNGAFVGGSSVVLKWDSMSLATAYHLQVGRAVSAQDLAGSGNLLVDENVGNATQYRLENLPDDGSSYYWRVKARFIIGDWGLFSPPWFFVNRSLEAPPVPELQFPPNEALLPGNNVAFQWKPAPRAMKYILQVATDPDFTDMIVNRQTPTSAWAVDHFGDAGQNYYWRVKAGNTTGWSEFSETFRFVNGFLHPPIPISPNVNANAPGDSVLFSWAGPARATRFHLQVANDPAFRDIFAEADTDGTTETLVAGFPDDSSRFYWRVKGGVDAGWSAYSIPSTFINGEGDALPLAPVPLRPGFGSMIFDDSVEFRWTRMPFASKYCLQVSADDAFTSLLLDLDNVETPYHHWEDTELENGLYFWRVKAGNDLGWGEWSLAWRFRVANAEDRRVVLTWASVPFRGGRIALNPAPIVRDAMGGTEEPFVAANALPRPLHGWYAVGTTVTLTAQPETGFIFIGWRGAVEGNENPAHVVLDRSKHVWAAFRPTTGQAVSLADIQGMPGDEVVLRVNIMDSSTTITEFNFDVNYPESHLRLDPAPQGDCVGALTNDGSWSVAALEVDARQANVAGFCAGGGVPVGSTGSLAEIRFRIPDTAIPGTTATLVVADFQGDLRFSPPQVCKIVVLGELPADLEQYCQVTARSNFRLGVWDYVQSNWIKDAESFGSDVFDYTPGWDRWLCLAVYDHNLGRWTEGLYMYRANWGADAGGGTSGTKSNAATVRGAEARAVLGVEAAPDNGPAVFGPTQLFQAASNGNMMAAAWNYALGEETSRTESFDGASLPYECPTGEWICLYVYNHDLAKYMEAAYVYREAWGN